MLAEDVISAGIAPGVKFDAINAIFGKQCKLRGRYSFGLNKLKIKFNRASQLHLGNQHTERLTISGLGHAHRAKLISKVGTIGPATKLGLDAAVDFRTVG